MVRATGSSAVARNMQPFQPCRSTKTKNSRRDANARKKRRASAPLQTCRAVHMRGSTTHLDRRCCRSATAGGSACRNECSRAECSDQIAVIYSCVSSSDLWKLELFFRQSLRFLFSKLSCKKLLQIYLDSAIKKNKQEKQEKNYLADSVLLRASVQSTNVPFRSPPRRTAVRHRRARQRRRPGGRPDGARRTAPQRNQAGRVAACSAARIVPNSTDNVSRASDNVVESIPNQFCFYYG